MTTTAPTPAPTPDTPAYEHIRPDRRRQPTDAAAEWFELAAANPGAWFRVELAPQWTEEQCDQVRLDLAATRWLIEDPTRWQVSTRRLHDQAGRFIRYRVCERKVAVSVPHTALRRPARATA